MPDPIFVESVDVDAAWEVYYRLADRRHKDGLTIDQLRQVIEAALVGAVEAEKEETHDCLICGSDLDIEGRHDPEWQTSRRFVSPWVEVEEHQ